MPLTVNQLTDRLVASYARAGGINHLDGKNLPSKRAIALITADLLRLLFPGFFDEKPIHSSGIKAETASLLEVVRQEYIKTARLKGMPEKRVIFRHALKNALIATLSHEFRTP